MASSRQRLCELLDRSKITEGLLRLRSRLGSPWLTVLTYHRVFEPPEDYALDRGVIDVGQEAFDAQLQTLKQYFNIVTTEELRAHVSGEEKLPPNSAMITFDDGYLDNLRVAAPVLTKNDCRAVFFIATSFIEERRIYWWDRIAYLLNRAENKEAVIELDYPTKLVLDLGKKRDQALGTLLQLIKEQFALDLERLLSSLAEQLGVPWDRDIERALANETVMQWDELRELQSMGMDIQSHTRTHRALHTVPFCELVSELKGSKDELERELKTDVYAISYPIGRANDRLDSVQKALEDAGYELGFTNGTGPHLLLGSQDNRFNIPRIAMEPDYTGAFFRGVMAIPQLGYGV